MFPTEIRTMPGQLVVGLIHRGAYNRIGETFEKAGALLNAGNLWSHCGPAIGMYFNDPAQIAEAELRSLAGAAWLGDAVPEGFESVIIAGGKTAVLTLKGSYTLIKSGYDELYGAWLPGSGEAAADAPCYEVYLNDPGVTAPDQLLTEICLSLK